MAVRSKEAYVSLVTNDAYCMGALALGWSLRLSRTRRKLSLLITQQVSQEKRSLLASIWDELVEVEELDSGSADRLALLGRPELGVTFSKINAWKLTQYDKCVFLDADTLVLQNVDELFDREELSAAPDVGWPDCFNSGVFVFRPSMDTYHNLLELARHEGSFDGGDQGLLNLYWSDWSTKDIKFHLPFIYNMVPNVTYGYAPAYERFGRSAKVVHFIGSVKPWHHRYLPDLGTVLLAPGSHGNQHCVQDLILRWWKVYQSALVESPAGLPVPGHSLISLSHPPPPHFHSSHLPVPPHVATSHSSVGEPLRSLPGCRGDDSSSSVGGPHANTESDALLSPDSVLQPSHSHPLSSSPPSSSPLPPPPHPPSSHSPHSPIPPTTTGEVQGSPGGPEGTALDFPSSSPYNYMPLGGDSHRAAFESGNIDYFGRDSFDNILAHMSAQATGAELIQDKSKEEEEEEVEEEEEEIEEEREKGDMFDDVSGSKDRLDPAGTSSSTCVRVVEDRPRRS